MRTSYQRAAFGKNTKLMADYGMLICLNPVVRGVQESSYAQELMTDPAANTREQIQEALDAGERPEWHLPGVSNVLPERGVILSWDTAQPSFARRTSAQRPNFRERR